MSSQDLSIVCATAADASALATVKSGFTSQDVSDRFRWLAEDVDGQWLLLKQDDQIVGWAALSRVSSRCIYSGVAEVSIYVKHSEQRKGVGRALLQTIISESEQEGYWTLQAGIFSENEASLALFTSQGFREVGFREQIGELNSVWRDVTLLERRSKVVGICTGEEITNQ